MLNEQKYGSSVYGQFLTTIHFSFLRTLVHRNKRLQLTFNVPGQHLSSDFHFHLYALGESIITVRTIIRHVWLETRPTLSSREHSTHTHTLVDGRRIGCQKSWSFANHCGAIVFGINQFISRQAASAELSHNTNRYIYTYIGGAFYLDVF